MLPTRWLQLKVGPSIRGERDRRIYTGTFEREPWAVDRALSDLLRPRRHVPEPARLGRTTSRGPGRSIVVFTGLADYFERLVEHRSLVRDRLMAISMVNAESVDRPAVVAHARRADFPVRFRTPDSWYVATARFVRSCGYEGEIGLVSDGAASELSPLIDAGFVPLRGRNALEDLWTLAGATVVLASGVSTFSSWATYLGEGVTLTPDYLDCTGLDRLLPQRVKRIGINERSADAARVVAEQLAGR